MTDTPRGYVPADPVCLGLGIGLSFAGALLIWLLAGLPFGLTLLALGVIAAVGGMLLAGFCARSRERDILGIGRLLGLRKLREGPAPEADDPYRRLERAAEAGGFDDDGAERAPRDGPRTRPDA